jgi:hypothetical protein
MYVAFINQFFELGDQILGVDAKFFALRQFLSVHDSILLSVILPGDISN